MFPSVRLHHMTELLLDSSKLRDRVTVPLPKLTLGLWILGWPALGSQSLPLVLRLMDEEGDEPEDPPLLPDLFLDAVLCLRVALAATLKACAAVLQRTSSMVFLEGLKRMMYTLWKKRQAKRPKLDASIAITSTADTNLP